MVKNELLKKIVDNAESKYTRAEVDEILSTFSSVVVDTLKENDEKITLGDLGTFSVKHVPEKNGVSALTGKPWTKSAHNEIVFKVSKKMKDI